VPGPGAAHAVPFHQRLAPGRSGSGYQPGGGSEGGGCTGVKIVARPCRTGEPSLRVDTVVPVDQPTVADHGGDPVGALADAIRRGLADAGDPERAIGQQRYMKSAMPYRGVVTAEVRTIAKRAVDELGARPFPSHAAWEATIRTLWDDATHREERYAALAVARHRASAPHRAQGALPLYRHLVETGAWWDLVDETATHLVRDELLGDPDRVGPVMLTWAGDPCLWVRRAAILCQVGARDRVDVDLLADVIVPNLEGSVTAAPDGTQDFFIRKAIGWALRDAARRRPEWVWAFVDTHRGAMARLTVREALKHQPVAG
jgi:3-methyladenine DNA glycosylase AlkD